MANLFSINNGKITYNNVSTKDVNNILEKNKKNKIKKLEKTYKNASQIVDDNTQKIGNYLNENGQNVNINKPFQANLISNKKINDSKKNLNGRVTLQDVVQEHTNLMNTDEAKELKNNLRISKNEKAWAGYNLNQAKVENEKTTFADKTIGNVTRGVVDLFSNMTDSRDVVDGKGNTIRLPSYNELKQQKVSKDYKTGIGKFLGDATYNISKIGASTLINVPTLGIGGTSIYWSDMYFDSYHNAKNQGYSEDRAFAYALGNAGFEFITGKFLGSATKGLTGGQTSQLSNAISNGINKLISNPKMSSVIGNAGSEAVEEFLQEYIENINRLITLEGSTNAEDYIDTILNKEILKDAIYSAGIGALSGGTLGSINNTEGKNVNSNTKLFKEFKTQLEKTKNNLKNKNEIAKYDKVIKNIDDYLQRPFGNNTKAQTIIPTVQDIVAQEKNSATASNAKIPRLTPETDSGTSSFDEKTIFPTNDALIAPNRTSETDGALASSYGNNIAQSNDGVNVPINNKNTVTLSNEQQAKLKELDNSFKSLKSLAERNHPTDKNFRDKRIKGYAMEIAAQKREVVQGDWLIPIEGGLTQIELNKKIERLKSSYIGKQVTVDGNNGKIFGNSYGKVGVEFEDGTRKYFEKTEINPIEDIDAIIKQQKTLIVKQKYQSARNQVPTEQIIKQTKGNIPINQELLKKHSNVKSIFDEVRNKYDGEVKIDNTIDMSGIDFSNLKSPAMYSYAKDIFNKNHKTNEFYNNGNKIIVSNRDIKHTVTYIYKTPGQKNMLPQHLLVFSDLGDIIEHAKLINQSGSNDIGTNENSWHYYYDNLDIKGEKYTLVFDVVSRDNGENHYRVQRLEKQNIKKMEPSARNIANSNITLTHEDSISDNNIPQINQNVKLPVISNNNTQNNESNTSKIINPNEISNLTLEDANTTPNLPTINVTTGRGESKFAKNIENKTDMLTKESKYEILDSNEVKYYQEVTNEGSLKKAFERLNKGGASETLEWFNKKENFSDVDVAEGWILLKQYQDKIQNATNLTTKDTETRNMVQVAKKLREMGTKAGQTVQAYNILNRLTPEGMVYYAQSELSEAFDIMTKNKTKEWIDSNREKFNLTPQETEFIMKTMQEVQQMKDGYDKRVKLAEIQKVMTDKLPPSKGSEIKAWMRISMLFNPKTQVRNVMGNALIAPVNTFSDLFASVVDKQIAKKTGVRTTGNIDLKNYLKGFKEGAYQSYNDFKKGINTRNIQGNRFEITEGKSFNDNTSIGKALNRVDSILSFMLDAGDRTFYEATFTNSINNQLKLNNKTEVTQEMIDIATQEALSRTWQDNNNYTKFVLSLRKGLNFGLNYGLGDVLIPFAKTPANLTKAIVDYSPAGMIKTINEGINLKRSLSNGQYNAQMQHQFVQDLGKATAGSMLYILGYVLAKAGINSGESDDDKDVANFLKNTLGVSSYSIKLGNKSFTYDWAQPIAAPFAMTANLLQKQKDGADLKESIISTLDTGLNVLFEQSFLESMSNVLSESGQIGTKLTEQILDLPSRAVPTLLKQIGDLIDPIQRTSFEKDKPLETSINKVKAKVPILSKTLAPSVDTMGREIQKYGGKNNIFNVFLNPSNVNTENISKSAEEIYRLYKSTGDATIMPRVAPYNINQSGEKILLSSEQKSQYQKISGNIIENSVKELLNKAAYKNLDDIEKADIINKIVGYSYNKAREEVLNIEMSNTYNKINQYIADGGKISDYYLNKEEVDYSYNNPEKYRVITQITTYDKYLTYQDEIDNVKTKYTNSNQRKTAVIKYVNSLNLSIPQKAMLIKLNYSSYDSYNEKIIQYINKQNITREEKIIILTKLGFTIRNGRVYS